MNTSRLKESKYVALFVGGAIVFNFLAKYFASTLSLPVWLDSIGTILIAYMYGPFCGAVVGAAVNISYGLFDQISLIYCIPGTLIGVTAGFMARKKYFESFYKASVLGMALCVLSTVSSVPLNLIFYEGYTSNVWGDAVLDFTNEFGFHRWIGAFLGEFTVDIMDKCLTVFVVFLIIKINKLHMKKTTRGVISAVLVALVSVLFFNPIKATAAGIPEEKLDRGFFTTTIYNGESGLPGGEANAIEFSNDGYIWVGTYSGLYRFNGTSFEKKYSDVIKNVNVIFRDEEGRMWVGTNDAGVAVMVDSEVTNLINEKLGMSSDSITCIGNDENGFYYVGTKESLDVIKIVGGIRHIRTINEVDYAISLAECGELMVAVCNDGSIKVMKEGKYLYSFEDEEVSFSCARYYDGKLFIGTFTNEIFIADINEKEITIQKSMYLDELNYIKNIKSVEEERLYVCANNGVGFFDENYKFHKISTGQFSTSIYDCGNDYQGNLWLVSSRLGLCKLTESIFNNIVSGTSIDGVVVNAVTYWEGKYYLGTDQGIYDLGSNYEIDQNSFLSRQLDGQRVRNLFVDSKNNLWISITSGVGLVRVSANGDMHIYNESNGTLCNRFRSVTELSDGTIVVAEDAGLDFIYNGKIVAQISRDDGLINPMVLTLCEVGDALYAGTDGSGIAVIRNSKIEKIITKEDGLSSEVILRIIKVKERELVVTSNGINVLERGTVRDLTEFPYSNNFDIYKDKSNRMWVLSSAGVYVCDQDSLIKNDLSSYMLLDYKYGLTASITANSWGYMRSDGTLLIPCNDGCYAVDTTNTSLEGTSYRVTIEDIKAGEQHISIDDDRTITIPSECKDLTATIAFPNYTSNDVNVGYMVEGLYENETFISANGSAELKLNNIPRGSYKLIINLYNGNHTEIIESISYNITKEARFFENAWFKFYLVFIYGLFIAWVTWMLLSRSLAKEREKREQFEHEVQMSNEMIMTIAKTVDAKDSRTSKHSERVANYSRLTAKALAWSDEDCEQIYKAGLLHDIGKIGIPDIILNKPTRLTDEEYNLMKTHVDRGAEILKGFTAIKNVDLGVRYHHERFDGFGYPEGLKGEEIPLQARIIAIADAFDAMTSNRVYRQKLDLEFVISEMRKNSGAQFDPELLEIFLLLLEEGKINIQEVLGENRDEN